MGLRRTVLCVDDYQALLDTMGPALASFGYDILMAHNLEEACALAARHPDVILLEYRLCPGCHGDRKLCLATRFHAISPETRIVVWCADGEALRRRPPCAEDVLMKPLAPEELAEYLDRALGTFPVSRPLFPAGKNVH